MLIMCSIEQNVAYELDLCISGYGAVVVEQVKINRGDKTIRIIIYKEMNHDRFKF